MTSINEIEHIINLIDTEKSAMKNTTEIVKKKLLEFQNDDFANKNKSAIDNSLEVLFRDINFFERISDPMTTLETSVKDYIKQLTLLQTSYRELIRFLNNEKLKFGLQGRLKQYVKRQYPYISNDENDSNLSDYERAIKDVANLPNEETPMPTGGRRRKHKITHKRIKKTKK